MLHIFRCLLGLTGLLLGAGTALAQGNVGYGDWQLHLPTNRPVQLADAGDRVYVATENAFYFLDKTLNTTQVLSSRDGLNDVGVVALAYDSVTRQTVLGYRNTNLDILKPNGRIRNLNDILRKSIQGAKTITRIATGAGKAYVCTSFGVVVIDLAKLEVTDTYSNIGPGGTVVAVYDAAVANGALHLATSAGLLRGLLTSNLLDFRSWTTYQPAVNVDPARRTFPFVAAFGGEVYAAVEGNGLGVFKFVPGTPGVWRSVPNTRTAQFRNLRASSTGVFIIDDDSGVRNIGRNDVVTNVVPRSPASTFLQDAVRSRDGSFYLANFQLGLQRVRPNSGMPAEQYVANGPVSNLAFSILADARTNTVDVFTGGYSERYDPSIVREGAGFYEFKEGQWTSFTAAVPGFPSVFRPTRGTRTPDGTLYFGGYGDGLVEWKGLGQTRRFGEGTPAGSPLLGTFGSRDRVEITDLTADADGKVWVVNRHLRPGTSGLFIFDPVATTWRIMPWRFGYEALDRLVLDDSGYAWASVSRKTDPTNAPLGIFAVDPAPTNPQPPRFFTTASGLPDNQVYELAKDRRGYIWAATIKGVAVFNDPRGPFEPDAGFILPLVPNSKGELFPVLFSEAVRTLAVDGGDRKWFGTDNGLWLFTPDADKALLHFTTANSPLPSNRIVDVKVNDKTGDVWVATDAGVVAYRGAATITEGKPSCAAVFPNPVRPEFAGTVGITGLANNAQVKITDVAGHLVYATTANGGTVTWNLTSPDGKRVRSGTYLVLSADADGKNGCVSKVAVLR